MSLSNHQYDPADELLSAYLDGELDDAQRVEVEARLASDPAAAQTLAELRAVSQAVRDLPGNPADDHLASSVMQRVASATTGSPADDSPPRSTSRRSPLPVGRSWRGWAWAAMAIAASLMLMVYQGGEPRNGQLDVARRADEPNSAPGSQEPGNQGPSREEPGDREELEEMELGIPAEESGPLAPPPSREASPSETPSDPPESDSAPPVADRVPEMRALRGEAASTGSAAREPPAPATSGGFAAGETAGNDHYLLESAAEAAALPGNVLVVRVNMPESSRRRGEFERTLAQNQIVIDNHGDEDGARGGEDALAEGIPQAASRDAVASDDRAAGDQDRSSARALAASEPSSPTNRYYRARNILRQQPAPDSPPVDVFVTEAPLANVFGCISQIKEDQENYLAVEVEQPAAMPVESPGTSGEQAAATSAPVDIQRFSRGRVPREQKLVTTLQNPPQQQRSKSLSRRSAASAGSRLDVATGDQPMQVYFYLGTEPAGAPSSGQQDDAE